MELKYYQGNCKCGRTVSSNRTFMELKYMDKLRERAKGWVLIAPLWN